MSEAPRGQTQPDDLVEEIDEIRARLADTVDALIDRTNPRNIVRRSLYNLWSHFVDETGSPKLGTIGPLVGATVVVVAGIIVIRRRVR